MASKLGQLQMMDGQIQEGLTTLRRCVMQAEEHYNAESQGYSTALPQHLEVLAEGLQRSGDLMGARDLLHRAMGLRRVRQDMKRHFITLLKRRNQFSLTLIL